MGTFGPNGGSVFADDASIGTISLSGAANALVSDDAYTTFVLLLGQIGHYLKATGFGFTIPLDATILGIQVDVERSSTVVSATQDQSVRLVKGGTISGDNKASASFWPTTDAYQSYGGAADLWGLSLTPADVNLSTFGVAIAPAAALAGTARIDHVRMTVTYEGSNRPNFDRRRLQVGALSCVERVS